MSEDQKSEDKVAKIVDENFDDIIAELEAMHEETRKGRTETQVVAGTRINWRYNEEE